MSVFNFLIVIPAHGQWRRRATSSADVSSSELVAQTGGW